MRTWRLLRKLSVVSTVLSSLTFAQQDKTLYLTSANPDDLQTHSYEVELEGVSSFSDSSQVVMGLDLSTKYVVRKDDILIGGMLRQLGQWELPFQRLVAGLLLQIDGGTEGATWVDVGSNVGAWSIFFATMVGPRGRVVSYEPQLDLIAHHQAALLLNGMENTHVVNALVSNSAGYHDVARVMPTAQRYTNYGAMSAASLKQPAPPQRIFRVPSVRLDDQLLLHGVIPQCPALVKLDIENSELDALLGAEALVRQCQPVLFIEAECAPLLRSLYYLLDAWGYVFGWVVLPIVDHSSRHFDRAVQEAEFATIKTLYGSRNLVAVPQARAALLRDAASVVVVDMAVERVRPADAHNLLALLEIRVNHQESNESFRFEHATTSYSLSPEGVYSCGGEVVAREMCDLWKTY